MHYLDEMTLDQRISFSRTAGPVELRTAITDRWGAYHQLSEKVDAIESGRYRVALTPWPCLGNLSKAFLPGSIVVLCGPPGSTKSLMVTQALAFWWHTGEKAALYSLEEDMAFHAHRILAQETGDARLADSDWAKLNMATVKRRMREMKDTLSGIGRTITAAEPGKEVPCPALLDWVHTKAVEGARVIVVDPITAMGDGGGPPWVVAKRFVLGAKMIATRFRTTILLVTHPSKMTGGGNGSKSAKPNPFNLGDMAGGAAYGRFTSAVFGLERLQEQPLTVAPGDGTHVSAVCNRSMTILKARDGIGQGLRIGMFFDNQTLRLGERGIIPPRG